MDNIVDELTPLWQNPPSIYRGAPFWSWNGKLDADRLCHAIDAMNAAGLGGFFMHSRYGLKTPYLSEEWFQCIAACMERARTLDMKAYLYDEDRWPSGCAGGMVTRDNVEFRGRFLAMCEPADTHEASEHMALFAVELDDDGRFISYEEIEDGLIEPARGRSRAFHVETAPTSGWHNDGAYLDTMNPGAVREFIRVTHEVYAARYGKDFGGLIPAIFTDEPNYKAARGEAICRVPWTNELPRQFKRRRGYDLCRHLPELFLMASGQSFSKVRHDFYRTITELFVENFTGQIGKWCDKRHIVLTGHMLAEQTLASQTEVGGATMPHYEHMRWPGVDVLCDQAGELITIKQCTSVAAQLGHERVLSELYGCTGWDWPLEGHKFVGDWQYATGVNFRCLHLTHYSLAGGAKRDYPASIFTHSPWWKYYTTVEDYFARLGLMLTQGEAVRDVIVVHPIESNWGCHLPDGLGRAPDQLQESLRGIAYALTGRHYDWDFGDESLLAKHAKVDGKVLKVGRMAYRIAIVPPTMTLRSTTVSLLGKFLAAGGEVLFIGAVPKRIDAEVNFALAELVAQGQTCPDDEDELIATLEKLLPRRVSITEGPNQQKCMWAMLRAVEGGHVLFIQSHDRKKDHCVRVRVTGAAPAVLWDARTGQRVRLDTHADAQYVEFDLALAPSGSALVTLGLAVADADEAPPEPVVVETQTVEGPFDIELTEPNTMPLDFCRYRLGEEDLSQPVPTLKADELIRRRFGLDTRLGREHQPWYLYAHGTVDVGSRGPCQMQYKFHVTDVPKNCSLAIEAPENFRIQLNGQTVGDPEGHWVDEDIKTIPITPLLRAGENELLLSFEYRPDIELEDLYLVGDFGVRRISDGPPAPGNLTLVHPPRGMSPGSWVGQGLDFYGGAVRYHMHLTRPAAGRRLRVDLPGLACTVAAVHVGESTFVLPWPPFAADITDAMADGDNEVVIEVIGGRKNILGPLHIPWCPWTGPNEFSPDNSAWTHEYHLTDHGLLLPVMTETLA